MSYSNPTSDEIAIDRAVRKMQVTEGLSVINRLFAQFAILLCSPGCEPEKLITFKRGLRKILAMSASVTFHRTKDNIDDGHCSNIEKSELTNGDVEGDDDFAPRIAEYKCSSRGCGP